MSTYSKIKEYTHLHHSENGSIESVDMHTGGEPLRVIINGLPDIHAANVLDYRRKFRDYYDSIRTRLIHEPRGHSDMYGVYLVPPNDSDADFGAVFIHNEGYSTMCGHAIIALASLAVEKEWVEQTGDDTKVTIDAPCGRIVANVKSEKGKITSVSFEGVPSFVVNSSTINIDGKSVPYTLAYGGAYYAYVHAPDLGLTLQEAASVLIEKGMEIKRKVMDKSGDIIDHPFESDLSFLYGTIFTGGIPNNSDCMDRNVCIFADGEVDRSPTGSGVSGRMAIHLARGDIKQGQEIKIESISGSVFKGQVIETLDYGPYKAVIPMVSGTSFITGYHRFVFNPEDEFPDGFLLH